MIFRNFEPRDSNKVVEFHYYGMGALRIISAEEAEVKRMRVKRELQRKGIGQKILDHLLNHPNNINLEGGMA